MATAEEDILKTLLRIERALGGGGVMAGGYGRVPTEPKGAGTSDRENKKMGGTAGTKTFKATAAAMNGLADSTNNLNRSFTGLNKTVLNTRASLIEMNRTMRGVSRGTVMPKIDTQGQNNLQQNSNILNMFQTLSNIVQRPGKIPPGGGPPAPPGVGNGGSKIGNAINRIFGGNNTPGGKFGNGLTNLVSKFSFAGVAIAGVIKQLSGAVVPLVRDILALHSAGIQASSALGGLYMDAARSGMSLAEYTKVLEESSVAVTRSSSMADFNKSLQVSRDRLENLGIFGAEATKLSASLATSAVTLGVPQQKLADATNAQIDTFQQLRKSSLLTAESFQQLTAQLATQQEVQSNLLGLSPLERQARLNDITGMKTFGLSLGGSRAASDAFGDALLKQRDLTVSKRFESAGRIRQSGAIFGMNAGDTEQLAQLSRKKNLSGDDKATALRLGSQMQASIEEAMNSGDVNRENIAEQMQAALDSSGIGTLLKTAGNLKLSTDSGPAGVNKDFAQGASDLLKATGRLTAWLDGAQKNPIVGAISGALGSAAFSVGIGAAIGRFMGRGVPPVPGGGPPVPPGGAGGGLMSKAMGAAKAVIAGAGSLLSSIMNIGSLLPKITAMGKTAFDAVKGFGSGILGSVGKLSGSVQAAFQILKGGGMSAMGAIGSMISGGVKALGPTLLGGIKGILGGAFKFAGGSGLLSAVFGGVMELFTGDLGSALNAADDSTWFGDGIGGFTKKILGKIGDIIGAMVRGLITGFTGLGDLAIDAWNATIGNLFDGMRINLGASLTNFFDRAWTSMNIMFKETKLKVAKFFGMSDTVKELEADIKVAKETQSKLAEGGDVTLTTIGDANQKLLKEQKETAEKTKASVATATQSVAVASGVITSTEGLTQRLINDSAGIRGSSATQAQAVIDNTQAAINGAAAAVKPGGTGAATVAVPGQTARAGVVDPALNKPAEVVAPTTNEPTRNASVNAPVAQTTQDLLLVQVTAMNAILTQILTAEQGQNTGLDTLARALGRPQFGDSLDLLNRLQKT